MLFINYNSAANDGACSTLLVGLGPPLHFERHFQADSIKALARWKGKASSLIGSYFVLNSIIILREQSTPNFIVQWKR